MKKVMQLIRVQIWDIMASMFAIGDYKKKKTKAFYAGLALVVIVLGRNFYSFAFLLGISLKAFDSMEVLLSLFMAITCIMVLFTTIYKVKGTIFGFKDFDLVMSMPVSNGKIVASRLILLYIVNFAFVLIAIVPMTVAYGKLARPGVMFYLLNLIAMIFMPLIPIIIASVLGTVLAYVTMRLKYSNILYIVFIFILVIGWIFIMPSFVQASQEAMVETSKALAGRINRIYPLAGLYSKAVAKSDFGALIIFIGFSVLAFLIFSWGVGKVFIRINTEIMTVRYKADYRMGELKSSSPLMALYKKDFKRYFASPIYVLNTGFGMAILLLFSIAMPFINLKNLFGEMLPVGLIQEVMPLIIMFCMATSCTTMASVSIEGKNLWIVRSLPVSTATVFASKILVNLSVLAPSFLASIVMGITLRLPFINGILVVLSVASFAIFVSVYGLLINLSFPNLSWSNETVIVKQSAASLISIFSCIGLVGVQYALLAFAKNFRLGILLFICLIWLFNVLLYRTLVKYGVKKFEKL